MNSIFHLGDSKKEIEYKVAVGFPQVELNENEIIISDQYAKFFGFNIADKDIGKELFDSNLKLNMTFDLLALFLDKKQEKKFVQVLFENPKDDEIRYPDGEILYATKGQRVL